MHKVPEPTTILGLGAVGAVMAMSRRRKTLAN
ncbi:PEP-CTERM sorting domain-containing protein [Nostoc sp. XA013]|nr:PEP-CTERM sorting domain-containing protein [Nostoc sp. XA013]